MKWLKPAQRVIMILAIILITGCAGVQTPPNIIFQDDTHLVRLDRDRSIGGPDDPDRYTHPIEIGTDQLHTIFDSMRVEEHRAFLQRTFMGRAKQIRVLSENDVTVLAPQIREAFLQATPQEHVIFALINPVGNRYEVTAGEMFVKENAFHLILNCFQSVDAENSRSSLCGAIRQQGYNLSFTAKDYFVGFGNEFFGNGKKEIIVDYASIPSSAPPQAQLLPLEPEDSSPATADHVADVERDHIQMLERKIEVLAQVVDEQREALEQQPQTPQHDPPRILFLTSPPMHGEDIAALQRALGFAPDRIDGIFGKDTDRAVRTFQRQGGMSVDGKVGPHTLNALKSSP